FSPALEGRLETVHTPERTIIDETTQGEEVGIPATVVEHRERLADLLRLGDELACFNDGRHKRLVDDNGGTALEDSQALLEVRVRRRCEHNEVEIVESSEELIG